MYFSTPNPFDDMVKDIVERKDKEMAMEFAKKAISMLKDYGVKPVMAEQTEEEFNGNSGSIKFKCGLAGFDFSEHDMGFESEIADLKSEVLALENVLKRTKRVIVAREINGVPYVTLEDFLEAVKELD